MRLSVHNRHVRAIGAGADRVGELIDSLGGPEDRLWPVQDWLPLRLEQPLAVGSLGGHGPAEYRVVGYQPGRWLRMEFTRPRFLSGFHEFAVRPAGDERCVLEHLVSARLSPLGWLAYPIGLLPLHDQVVEMALDTAELTSAGRIAGTPVRLSRGATARGELVRLQLRLSRRDASP